MQVRLDRRLGETADAIQLGDRGGHQPDARFHEWIAGFDQQQRRELGGRDARVARGLDRFDAMQRPTRDRQRHDQLAAFFLAGVRRQPGAIASLPQCVLDRAARILEEVLVDRSLGANRDQSFSIAFGQRIAGKHEADVGTGLHGQGHRQRSSVGRVDVRLAHARLVITALPERFLERDDPRGDGDLIEGPARHQAKRANQFRLRFERRAGDRRRTNRDALPCFDRQHQLGELWRVVFVLNARQNRRVLETALCKQRLQPADHVVDAIGGRQSAEPIVELSANHRLRQDRIAGQGDFRDALDRNQLPAQRHSLIAGRRKDAHIFEAPETNQMIDRAADVAHAERFANPRFHEFEQSGLPDQHAGYFDAHIGDGLAEVLLHVRLRSRITQRAAARLRQSGVRLRPTNSGNQNRRDDQRAHQKASLFRTSSA